jgi:protoporphyrin/coproporphyrin ferrochelatase
VIDSVLLLSFGGPTATWEIRPFLEIVARGRRIPPDRLEEVAHHYELMPGSRSPINELTRGQAAALENLLRAEDIGLPVFIGQRNWHPFVRETLAEMAGQGHRRALGIILSPLRTEASWDRYMADVAAAREATPGAPGVAFAPAWGVHPMFVSAVADRVAAALLDVPEADRPWVPLVFTAHSVPVAMAERSPYVADFEEAAHAVVEAIDHPRFTLAYQSRSGAPGEPWLGPDIGEVVRSLAADGEKHAVVVPLGFVCDHVEILYDLDIEARGIAEQHGMAFHRARAVNDHPEFVAMLARLVKDVR